MARSSKKNNDPLASIKAATKAKIETRKANKEDFINLSQEEVLSRLRGTLPYKEEYSYYLIDHCYSGGSFETFPSAYCIPPFLIEKWRDSVPEFAEAIALALSYELKYWEEEFENATEKEDITKCKFRLERLGYRTKMENFKTIFKNAKTKDHNGALLTGDFDLPKEELSRLAAELLAENR